MFSGLKCNEDSEKVIKNTKFETQKKFCTHLSKPRKKRKK